MNEKRLLVKAGLCILAIIMNLVVMAWPGVRSCFGAVLITVGILFFTGLAAKYLTELLMG